MVRGLAAAGIIHPAEGGDGSDDTTPVATVTLDPERDAVIQAVLVQSQSNTRNGEAA